ncbi:MAG: hypothetical protein KGY56_07720 [Desulfobacterales bacterium]|nr:hypothetical protein [Desulfobacterales bacterium]
MIQKATITAIVAFCGITLTACFQAPAAAENWKIEDEEDSIKSYSRVVEDSNYHAFKATTTIDATMAQIGAVLRDVPNYPEWMAKVKEAEVLKRYSPNDMNVYLILNFPWPTSDRDAVATAKTEVSGDLPGTITTTRIMDDPEVGKKDGLVRVPAMLQRYIMRFREMEKTEVTYSIFLEAGGNLPAMTVNPSLEGVPHESLKNLKDFVKKDQYKNADPFNPVNMPVSETIAESILRTRFNDPHIIETVLADAKLVKVTLKAGFSEEGLKETTTAIMREYVKTPYFKVDIQTRKNNELLAELTTNREMVDEMVEDEEILELILAEGAMTGPVMDVMALFVKTEMD